MSIAVTLARRTAGYDFQLDATLLVSTLVSTTGAIHYLDEMNDATDMNRIALGHPITFKKTRIKDEGPCFMSSQCKGREHRSG